MSRVTSAASTFFRREERTLAAPTCGDRLLPRVEDPCDLENRTGTPTGADCEGAGRLRQCVLRAAGDGVAEYEVAVDANGMRGQHGTLFEHEHVERVG